MRKGGLIFAEIFKELEKLTKIGNNGKLIEHLAEKLINKYEVKPAFLNYEGFPSVICISKNQTIVHDVPNEKKFKRGDIIKLDFGIVYKDYYLDGANTYLLDDNNNNNNLLHAATKAFFNALSIIKDGTHTFDIARIIEETSIKFNVYPVRELVGHGIDKQLHKPPQIPCYLPKSKKGDFILKEGMTIALEIMFAQKRGPLKYSPNSFGIMTQNMSNTVHLEETILIKKTDNVRLTTILQEA